MHAPWPGIASCCPGCRRSSYGARPCTMSSVSAFAVPSRARGSACARQATGIRRRRAMAQRRLVGALRPRRAGGCSTASPMAIRMARAASPSLVERYVARPLRRESRRRDRRSRQILSDRPHHRPAGGAATALVVGRSAAVTSVVAATTEQGELAAKALQHDLGGVAFLARLIGPFAGLELALEIDGATLARYFSAISPRRSLKITTRCHSVRSRFSPLLRSRQRSLVATDRWTIFVPSWVWRTSGRDRDCPRE